MRRLQSIQILRFVAAALVVLKHSTNLHLGAAGVDVFFVISGFIIAKISQGKAAGSFMTDRVRRVYPIYFICSIPYALIYVAAQGFEAPKLIASLTLWPVVGAYTVPYLKQGWTLSFEMLFYSGTAFALWKPKLRWLLLAIYIIALPLSFTASPLAHFVGNPLILEFGMGFWIASAPTGTIRSGTALIAAAAVWLLCTIPVSASLYEPPIGSIWWLARALVWGLPATMIVFGALHLGPVASGRVASYLGKLGDASYSIYLTHMLVVAFLGALAPWPVVVLAAIVIGVAVHRYIEQPLLRLLRFNRPRQAAAQPA